MKQLIEQNLIAAVARYLREKNIPPDGYTGLEIDYTKDERHGDFASNIAMTLAKSVGLPPRKIAEALIQLLPETEYLEKTEIAGPGFINFFLTKNAYLQIVPEILTAGKNYGRSDSGKGEKVLLEYVSVNPTGPIHVGHGRGAAYGSVLARLLETAGYDVTTEFYVNDSGRQMDILAISVWLRYLDRQGMSGLNFPAKAYQGEYVADIAGGLIQINNSLAVPEPAGLIAILDSNIDEDKKLDDIIEFAKASLGGKDYGLLFDFTLNRILTEIRGDLEEFGIRFDSWFSERSLHDSGAIDDCISKLQVNGDLYEKDGAKWFRSTRYGDEKDRVVVRENGQMTYFASDIAYHLNKFERGYDEMIDIWGADHHGYIGRVKGALSSLGLNAEKLKILLVQFATLYRGKQKLQMSTRSGEYVTLKELRDEVGNDATRFFYVTRKSEQHLDFDLDLAKSQSNDNPVYYIQYAHARICSVFKQLRERGLDFDHDTATEHLAVLTEQHELAMVKTLSRYSDVVLAAAKNHEPHLLAFYLRELANDFHAYYNSCQFLVDEVSVRQARLCLITATRQVIKNGLDILGVSAPEEM